MRNIQTLQRTFTAGAIGALALLGAMSTTPALGAAYTLGEPDQTIFILCSTTETCSGTYDTTQTEGVQLPGDPTPYTGSSAITTDGTVIRAMPNPTLPSTGTGVFDPFLRVQDSGAKKDVDYQLVPVVSSYESLNPPGTYSSEAGFNSDASNSEGLNYETKPSDGSPASGWTRSVLFGELDTSDNFVTLKLDANEHGSSSSENNLIVITEMQIFVGQGLDNPEVACGPNCTGYEGERFDNDQPNNNTLLGKNGYEDPVWSLDGDPDIDGENGNVDIVLQASICDTKGNCGSGKGDLEVKIPISFFINASASDNFVLYFEAIKNHDGFEEWSFASKSGGVDVAEPGTIGLFGIALAGMGYIRRRPRVMNG